MCLLRIWSGLHLLDERWVPNVFYSRISLQLRLRSTPRFPTCVNNSNDDHWRFDSQKMAENLIRFILMNSLLPKELLLEVRRDPFEEASSSSSPRTIAVDWPQIVAHNRSLQAKFTGEVIELQFTVVNIMCPIAIHWSRLAHCNATHCNVSQCCSTPPNWTRKELPAREQFKLKIFHWKSFQITIRRMSNWHGR